MLTQADVNDPISSPVRTGREELNEDVHLGTLSS